MSFSNRYSSKCSCSSQVKMFAQQRGVSCCNDPIQAPPNPCCESHIKINVPGYCLRPTCSVAATDGEFYLSFKNTCDQEVPISLGNVFFFDQAAGYLNVHLYNGTSYQVSLVDPTQVGKVIEEDACVILTTGMASSVATTQRCLSGNFVAPAVDASQTIYILNGQAIPVGSTITFTAGGETGSYLVTAYVSGSENIYAYTVTNAGAGLTPGLVVNGGPANTCAVPIEVNENLDFCTNPDAEEVDSILSCLSGAARSLVPTGEDYVIRGTPEGTWTQSKFTNFDCCIFSEGTIKFSGEACTEAEDTVVIKDIGLDCFTEAYDDATTHNTIVAATIDGLPVIITSWNPGTFTITLRPATDDYLPGGETLLEYPAGTAICLGDCCGSCTNGPQTTNVFVDDMMEGDSTFIVGPVTLAYNTASPTEYLIGYNQAGVVTTLAIGPTYNDGYPAVIKPTIDDPLVIRQKICNTHPSGCVQDANIEYNYDIQFTGLRLPSELICHWQIGSFSQGSQTLEDDVTPNPFFNTSSQAKVGGQVVGIGTTQANIAGTNLGFAGPAQVKTFPVIEGFFKDHMQLPDCNCGLNIVWFYVLLSPQATITAGNITVTLAIRRYIEKKIVNQIPIPDNDPNAQGFN